ncbi:hypothetical protein JOF47_000150 [Paeniglutamicibacter kerguelensis]|uniref:Uncharacterized protein n=1 Tax=Paeniglutamicibacter kerguelensis TaxID=254788 RepID=A0ABS4XAD0_9MICC|nr:hypothetical protein [Paeniglutamicibacter kerguelensis]
MIGPAHSASCRPPCIAYRGAGSRAAGVRGTRCTDQRPAVRHGVAPREDSALGPSRVRSIAHASSPPMERSGNASEGPGLGDPGPSPAPPWWCGAEPEIRGRGNPKIRSFGFPRGPGVPPSQTPRRHGIPGSAVERLSRPNPAKSFEAPGAWFPAPGAARLDTVVCSCSCVRYGQSAVRPGPCPLVDVRRTPFHRDPYRCSGARFAGGHSGAGRPCTPRR